MRRKHDGDEKAKGLCDESERAVQVGNGSLGEAVFIPSPRPGDEGAGVRDEVVQAEEEATQGKCSCEPMVSRSRKRMRPRRCIVSLSL